MLASSKKLCLVFNNKHVIKTLSNFTQDTHTKPVRQMLLFLKSNNWDFLSSIKLLTDLECHWLLEDKWKTWSFQIKHLTGITTIPFLLPDQIISYCRKILRWSSWLKNTDFSYGSINPHVKEYTEKYSFVWKSSTSATKELNAFKIWSSIFTSVVHDKIAQILLSRNQNVDAVFCCICEKSFSLFSHLGLDKVNTDK